MPTIPLNRFDGGQAEDVRTTSLYQNAESNNFDIISEPFRLAPFPDSVAETADDTMADVQISDVTICEVSGNAVLVGAGYDSGVSSALTFYTKSDVISQWSSQASASGNQYIKGTLITYKTLAYAVDSNGSGTYRLIRFNSAGSVTTIGSITAPAGLKVSTFIHPEDNILYVVIGNVIAKWDGSSFSTVSTILPTDWTAQSITNYGGYLAIAMNPDTGERNPVCYLWGRDTSLNTLQGAIDLGEGYVGVVENLNNNLFFVMSPASSFSTNQKNKIIVKGYSGGSVETIFESVDSSTLSIGQVSSYKAKQNNRLYFAFGNSDCIWSLGKNKDGRWAVTQDRFIINGTQAGNNPTTQSIGGISIIGDIVWIGAFTTSGYTLQRTKVNLLSESITYNATSKYVTTINPNMPILDRYKRKELEAVQISFTGASSGTTVLKYSVDGSAMTTIISRTNAAGEIVVEATRENDSKNLKSGYEFQFQVECTGGSKIKEIRYKYNVLDTNI